MENNRLVNVPCGADIRLSFLPAHHGFAAAYAPVLLRNGFVCLKTEQPHHDPFAFRASVITSTYLHE